MPQQDSVLVCNASAGELRVKIFRLNDFALLVQGTVEQIGTSAGTLEIQELTSGRMIRRNFPDGLPSARDAFREVAGHLKHWQKRLRAAIHRVPFGHPADRRPVLLRPDVEEKLRSLPGFLSPWNEDSLAVAASAREVFCNVANIAVFDTAYYATVPLERMLYALPYADAKNYGFRRYGVHGIAHRNLSESAAEKMDRPISRLRLISLIVDRDSSLTAIKFGVAVDTTGGISPSGGLTGASSCGNVEATVVTSLQAARSLGVGDTAALLQWKSGVGGLFGCSNDLLDVMAACGHPVPGNQIFPMHNAQERKRAQLTLGIVVYELVTRMAGMIATMGGVDAIIFSGKVAERSAAFRSLVKERLKFFGVIKTLTLQADVELMMARMACGLALRYGVASEKPARQDRGGEDDRTEISAKIS